MKPEPYQPKRRADLSIQKVLLLLISSAFHVFVAIIELSLDLD